jgi:hypothetical protein
LYKKIHFILYQCHYKINNKLTIIFSAKEQKETKAMRERNCYASMTEGQRTSVRKRQNTPEVHQQKKSRRKMKKDALCPESIAMENPTWMPEMEWPVNQVHRATNFEEAWNDPNFFNPTWRPLSIQPKFEQSLDPVNNDDNDMTQKTRHRNLHMVSDKLYVQNRTNDSKIYVLICHLLHYTKTKVSWLLNYLQNIKWMTNVSL